MIGGVPRGAGFGRAACIVVLSLALSVFPCAAPAVADAATVSQLKQQMADLRDTARPAGDAYNAAVTDVENTQYRIKQANARIASATKKLTAAQDALGARADALYREGGDIGVIEFVLGSVSFEDFVTRVDLITMIADRDASLIKDVTATREGLRADRTTLTAELKREKAVLATATQRYNALQSRLKAMQGQYDRLMAAVSAGSGTKNPPGPNGMVFPVRGPHYYGNTWGAPRSGGRHHMGTDIMSPKGTPVVAITNGVARPHWNSLGGKSITLTGTNGWSYYYAHLNGYAIKGTVRVKAGQLIGWVGNTGNASGGANHLHFQMGPHGRWVNPYPYLRGME